MCDKFVEIGAGNKGDNQGREVNSPPFRFNRNPHPIGYKFVQWMLLAGVLSNFHERSV